MLLHAVNAILNYAYAILESHVRTEIATEGYDPTIGYLHTHQGDRESDGVCRLNPQMAAHVVRITTGLQSDPLQIARRIR